jgi:cytochrome c oxidase subunit II
MLAASEIARSVDRSLWLVGGVCIVLLTGITVAMLILVARYHRGRRKSTVQVGGHKLLEAVWITVPTIIVIWMFYVGYGSYSLIRAVPAQGLVVQVTGRQWAWSFHYPSESIDSDRMVVPVGTDIKCELEAPPEEVIHGFFIPDLRVKQDVVPSRTTELWFKADRPGVHDIFCTVFCGMDHSQMRTTLTVVTPEEYQKWVREQVLMKYQPVVFEAATDPRLPKFAELGIDGGRLYSTFCASCHGATGDGSGLPGEARDFKLLSGWKRSPKVADIYRTLSLGIENTRMRAYPNFSPWEKLALAHHVRSFLGDQAPKDSQQEYDALVAEYSLDKIRPPKEPIPIERAMEILVREAASSRPAGRE